MSRSEWRFIDVTQLAADVHYPLVELTVSIINVLCSGPSSSPPLAVNFASERAQKQHAKLRKKLDQNRSKGNAVSSTTSPSTPPTSPKKGMFTLHMATLANLT